MCATINGAKAMQMENRIGRIQEDYLADLLIVQGRPHEDVSCILAENILAVVKDGRPHGACADIIKGAQPGAIGRLRAPE